MELHVVPSHQHKLRMRGIIWGWIIWPVNDDRVYASVTTISLTRYVYPNESSFKENVHFPMENEKRKQLFVLMLDVHVGALSNKIIFNLTVI